MPIRTRLAPVALTLAVSLVVAACGGGSHSYKAGTPAVTGVAPDCSVVPLDLATKTLGMPLDGPSQSPRSDGVACTFHHPKGGSATSELVQLTGNATPETFAIVFNGLKAANNPVKKIHGWGDEAYAATVFSVININNFAVRKGNVAVQIQSTADYPKIRNLMKAVLAKL